MRQSSLTKLGSMINTAVNKRAGESCDVLPLSFFIVVFLGASTAPMMNIAAASERSSSSLRTYRSRPTANQNYDLRSKCTRKSIKKEPSFVPGYSYLLFGKGILQMRCLFCGHGIKRLVFTGSL
jgi:hypothetical protein